MLSVDELSRSIPIEQSGSQLVQCGKCKGKNLSTRTADLSSPEYAAACLECDEDMYLIELFYLDEKGERKAITQKERLLIGDMITNQEYMIKGPFHKEFTKYRCLGNYGICDGQKVYMTKDTSSETPESMAQKFASNRSPNCFCLWDFMMANSYFVTNI